MSSQITVFRSADEFAAQDAADVQQMLADAGIPAVLLDDGAPRVVEGSYEVRVDQQDQARAEQLIAQFANEGDREPEPGDPSEALDQVTVFRSAGAANEMEAMSVQSILNAGGIPAFIVGDARYPIFPQQVRVAKEDETRAKRLIADALAAGPAGAEEAEESGERE